MAGERNERRSDENFNPATMRTTGGEFSFFEFLGFGVTSYLRKQ